MSDRAPNPIALGLFGVTEPSRAILETMINQHAKGKYHLGGREAPQAAIFDMDTQNAEKLWAEYRSQHPRLPTIVISTRAGEELELPDTTVIKKPVSPQRLFEALTRLGVDKNRASTGVSDGAQATSEASGTPSRSSTMRVDNNARANITRATTSTLDQSLRDSDACGDAKDVDLNSRGDLATIYYSTDQRLQGVCEKAMKMARASGEVHLLSVDRLEHPILFLPQNGGSVITPHSLKRLRFFCVVPDITHTLIPVQDGVPPNFADIPAIPYSRFIWEVALWTARGRLPAGTAIDVPLRLKHWPDFSRQLETPHAMRLAAFWTSAPHSLVKAIEILGTPQRYVFAFFSAACATGLVEWHREFDESKAEPIGIEYQGANDRRHTPDRRSANRTDGDRRGLLGRILSHLSRQG